MHTFMQAPGLLLGFLDLEELREHRCVRGQAARGHEEVVVAGDSGIAVVVGADAGTLNWLARGVLAALTSIHPW